MFNRLFHKASLVGFSALLLFGSITASAEDRCDKRVRKAEMHLRQAVERHGEHSRQAEKSRRDLERAREGCRREDRR